jgi:hypothetical protein
MWKARSVALSTAAVLMLSLISGSASANPISTNLKACGAESSSLCLEKVELSIDGGANWVSLGQISSQHFSGTYDLANTGMTLENPNANALLVQIDHIQVAGSASETKTNNIQIWAYGIDRNQTMTFASMPISGLPIDSRATLKFTMRVGVLNATYSVGQVDSIRSSMVIGSEFNTLTIQGKLRQIPHFSYTIPNDEYWLRCRSTSDLAADNVGNYFQTMTFDYLGAETIWRGVDVSYTGSCGYQLDIAYSDGSPYPSLIIAGTAPHFLPDGVTLNEGHFEAVLPADFLMSRMGLTTDAALNGGLVAAAQYTPGKDTAVRFVAIPEANGAVRLVVDGVHFSSPKVVMKRAKISSSGIKVAGKPASITKGQKLTKNQVASLVGASVPAKSKITMTVSKKSTKAKICKISKGRLVALKKSGICTVTVKVEPAKAKKSKVRPVAVTTKANVTVS